MDKLGDAARLADRDAVHLGLGQDMVRMSTSKKTMEAACFAASIGVHAAVIGMIVFFAMRTVHEPMAPLKMTSLSVSLNLGPAHAEIAQKPSLERSEEPEATAGAIDVEELKAKAADAPVDAIVAPIVSSVAALDHVEQKHAQPDLKEAKIDQAEKAEKDALANKPDADLAFADEVSWPNFANLGQGSFTFSIVFDESGSVSSMQIISSTFGEQNLTALRKLLAEARAPRGGRLTLEMDVAAEGASDAAFQGGATGQER